MINRRDGQTDHIHVADYTKDTDRGCQFGDDSLVELEHVHEGNNGVEEDDEGDADPGAAADYSVDFEEAEVHEEDCEFGESDGGSGEDGDEEREL